MNRQTLNMDMPNIYTEVTDIQGMNLHILSYTILGLKMSKGKIPTILSRYLDLHCPTNKPSTVSALVPYEQ